ncbi:MAG: NUDIX hydrolase [Gammaproteobacteria bacterium]|nr:NUDIX hydrolase [Gammaproteobacteria bacterium]MCY4219367.1 NUDIX hydrolase [Gammaproteobacteria bacterium]MCY4274760.1 NUDIX hydrolase [Gammaproteobacteria bacterium]
MIQKLNQGLPIQYCNLCGSRVRIGVPEGDNRERHICDNCGFIQYQNPKVVVGSIITFKQKILLCKRAIEPRLGYWTIPAGFLENHESIQQGSIRETWEEARAKITNMHLYQITNLIRIGQIYIIYRAELDEPFTFGPGPESLHVKLFDEMKIPWDDMAFRVIKKSLGRFLEERVTGTFTMSVDTRE